MLEGRNHFVQIAFHDAIEIIEGIDEGDLVVVDGGFFLKSQMLTEQFADKD